jgi:hypothetical protein
LFVGVLVDPVENASGNLAAIPGRLPQVGLGL